MMLILAILLAGQIGGKLINGGNPTPGTPQPEPPNVADRVTATGCVQLAPKKDGKPAAVDGNTVTDSRYVLTAVGDAEKVTYRLEAIESQLSPFVGAKVEITGEKKPKDVLLVEFAQKLSAACK
jgi:hypothetical protein